MEKNIIRKEVRVGKGMYLIEIDREKAHKLTGSTKAEQLMNLLSEVWKRGKKTDTAISNQQLR